MRFEVTVENDDDRPTALYLYLPRQEVHIAERTSATSMTDPKTRRLPQGTWGFVIDVADASVGTPGKVEAALLLRTLVPGCLEGSSR